LAGSLFLVCSVVIAWLSLRGRPDPSPQEAPAPSILEEEATTGIIPDEPMGA
jgi:hypothetical protein